MSKTRTATALVDIRHEGDEIGDDWSYDITIHGDCRRIPMARKRGRPKTSDTDIPKLHWEFRLPGCFRHELVLQIKSTEHDVVFDDVGAAPAMSRIIADPEVGESVQTTETRVTELVNGTHVVRFTFNVSAECF